MIFMVSIFKNLNHHLLVIYFFVNLKVKNNDTIGILSQLIYFSLFGTKFWYYCCLFTFSKNKDLLMTLKLIEYSLSSISEIYPYLFVIYDKKLGFYMDVIN